MKHARVSLALLALTVPAVAVAGQAWELAQLTIRQRVMVRVPRVIAVPAPKPVRWVEKKGPKCIPAAALAGALVTERDKLDLVLRGGARVRAVLEDDCHGLDFYRGFYLKPAADGLVCADRDPIRSRSGDKCPIDRFRSLEPREVKR